MIMVDIVVYVDLHDSSAFIVFRGEVVLAAGGDGGQDGGVLQGVKV